MWLVQSKYHNDHNIKAQPWIMPQSQAGLVRTSGRPGTSETVRPHHFPSDKVSQAYDELRQEATCDVNPPNTQKSGLKILHGKLPDKCLRLLQL